jgi:hypothetical protein
VVTFRSDACDKCKNASPVSFSVEAEEAWRAVVLNRRRLCKSWSSKSLPSTALGHGPLVPSIRA